ncbi:cyclic nucleotide-binding domain-containing protein [Emticicia sp. CRIBPO]|uniref:Crp/Fnr family transcriptional regulator n=1 Tax=Emticicia sp. CRIBPO TaxID=2683258 RepID=UPI001411CDFD|nr:Crp/Fnr family transcriptional regulator [Emticicia sp. CRIBPO]NBA87375.1 cyclic nucleotide-binding domain-containing protein [Emticicia sp. CRIBPO]
MNHFYEKFFDYVAEILIMPEADKELCRQLFKPVVVPKDTIIETAGTVHKHHTFIVSGFMRNYHIDNDGNEIINDLNDGSRFFTSYFHFMNRTVSNENIQCISDCELLQITRDDVDIAASQGITQKDYTVQILNKRIEVNKQRAFDMANLTAEKRYEKFVKENPNIIQNVPLSYIASFLGITRRHLSRLRKEI